MTSHELVMTLNTPEPESEVLVAFFKQDGTRDLFEIEGVHTQNGYAQLEIYAEEDVTNPRGS